MPSDEAWTQQLEDVIQGLVGRGMSRPQRRNLWSVVSGRMGMLEPPTLTGLASQPGVHRHASSLKRFMTHSRWDDRQVQAELQQAVLDAIACQPAEAPIQLIIDDTSTVKYGPHMEGIGQHYCNGRIRWGHCKVTLCVVCGEVKVPWDFRVYVPETPALAQGLSFASKPALAQEMLAAFPELPGRKVCVLFDTGYCSKALLKYVCLERKWDVVARMECHRTVRHWGRKLPGKEVAARRPASWWQPLGVDDFEGGGLKVTLWRGIRGQLVMTRRDGEGLEAVHFLVTNRRDLSAPQVAKLYGQRWYIETYHRDAKQLLGLAHYQRRPLRGLRRHWTLVDLAYTALRLQACRDNHLQTDASRPKVTLGSLRQQFRLTLEQKRLRAVIEIYRATEDYQQAYQVAGCAT